MDIFQVWSNLPWLQWKVGSDSSYTPFRYRRGVWVGLFLPILNLLIWPVRIDIFFFPLTRQQATCYFGPVTWSHNTMLLAGLQLLICTIDNTSARTLRAKSLLTITNTIGHSIIRYHFQHTSTYSICYKT